jgi:hypothetical protein
MLTARKNSCPDLYNRALASKAVVELAGWKGVGGARPTLRFGSAYISSIEYKRTKKTLACLALLHPRKMG